MERTAVRAGPVAIGAAVFVIAFTHIHDMAVWAGRTGLGGAEAWIIACTGEVMAIVALCSIMARRRAVPGQPAGWPVFVLVVAVLFSGVCNVVAPFVDFGGDAPGAWVAFMAVWPVIAFGLVTGLKATKAAAPPAVRDVAPSVPVPVAVPDGAGTVPDGAGTVPKVSTVAVPDGDDGPSRTTAGAGAARPGDGPRSRSRGAAARPRYEDEAALLAAAEAAGRDLSARGEPVTRDSVRRELRVSQAAAARVLPAAKNAASAAAAAGWVPAPPELVSVVPNPNGSAS
jgi:hypothetical protein